MPIFLRSAVESDSAYAVHVHWHCLWCSWVVDTPFVQD